MLYVAFLILVRSWCKLLELLELLPLRRRGKQPNPPTPFPTREGGELFSSLLVGEGLGERSEFV